MYFTPRRRAVIALLAASPLAWFCVEIGWRVVYNLLEVLHNGSGFLSCGSGVSGLVSRFNGCRSPNYHWGYAVIELFVLAAFVAAVAYGLARWVTWPVRSMAQAVGRFGPNSLGLRLRAAGPRDETRELADAIDAMLDRLADGYEAQRRFAASASHELRTPLATQRALIEVSLGSALTEDQLALLTRQLLATNERNERLVDGLLTLAETERGLMARSVLRLDSIVAETVEALRPAAKEHGVELRPELAPVRVVGEQPLLDRLAGNLIGNAIKYNDDGGRVDIRVAADGTFSVANTGPVVPPDQVGVLFEPFRRLAGERLESSGGVGLGLTIARSIVAAHGGAIAARPRPGGGLVVDVRLRPA